MIALFVTKLAEVEVDVVEAMDGGKSKALTEAHEYTVTSVLPTTTAYQRDGQMVKVDQATRTYRRALTCHLSATSATKSPEVAAIGST